MAATSPAVRVRITIPYLPRRNCRCKTYGSPAGSVKPGRDEVIRRTISSMLGTHSSKEMELDVTMGP
jgi:hypothetical protein